MSDLTVDVSELRDAQRALVADATTAVTEVVITTLGVAIRNQCWGTDDIGGAFAHSYLQPAEETLAAVHQVPYQIGSIGERLGDAAAGYADTEETNVGQSQAVTTDLGGGPGGSA